MILNPYRFAAAADFGLASRDFDGTADHIDIGINPWDGYTAMTIAAWINLDVLNINQGVVGSTDNINNRLRLMVRTTNQIDVLWGDGTSFFSSTLDGATISSGVWTHIAATIDSAGNCTRYIDGSQTGTVDDMSSYGAVSLIYPLFIGARNSSGAVNLPLNGKIADVRIYDADIGATEVANLAAGTDYSTNLQGRWLGNDDIVGSVVDDLSGNGNTGTNFGSTYDTDGPLD